MTKMAVFFLLLFCVSCEHSLAKPKAVTDDIEKAKPTNLEQKDTLDSVRSKYANYEQINLKIKKTTYLEVLDKTKVSPQKIYVTNKGEIRVDTEDVPKSTTILANNKALVIDEADPEFGGPVRVLVSKNQNLKQSSAFLTVLFGKGELSKFYAVTKKTGDVYSLKAVDSNLSAQKVELTVNAENLQMSRIVYWDELKNKITLDIETTAFLKERNSKLFQYTIPKDAEVTEI
jgi:outer membrane lipoprotein-sorting protein